MHIGYSSTGSWFLFIIMLVFEYFYLIIYLENTYAKQKIGGKRAPKSH
jgi:hypothetical protein